LPWVGRKGSVKGKELRMFCISDELEVQIRRTLLQRGDCDGFTRGFSDGDSIPSVFIRKFLS